MFTVADVYRAVPGLSCRVWAIVTLTHPSLRLLVRLLDYRNFVKDPVCPHTGDDDGTGGYGPGDCADVVSQPGVPIQGCSRGQTGRFNRISRRAGSMDVPRPDPWWPRSSDDSSQVVTMNPGGLTAAGDLGVRSPQAA